MILTNVTLTILLALLAITYQLPLMARAKARTADLILVVKPTQIKNPASDPQTDDSSQLLEQADKLVSEKKLSEAITLVERVISLRRQARGEEHASVAEALSKLAYLHKLQGNWKRAVELYEQTLKIQEKVLGPDHLEVADTLNSLALNVQENGDRNRAEELLLRALRINEKIHGSVSEEVAINLNNLGALYYRRVDLEKSLRSFERALEIKEKLLGSENVGLATPLGNIALIRQRMGDFSQAEALHERALRIREKEYGPKHQDVVLSLNNLATLYRDLGEYRRAAATMERAAAVSEELLGSEHRQLAVLLHNLGSIYSTEGDFGRARLSYERALKIKEKVLGVEHLSVATTLNGLALVYQRLGNLDEAERLYKRALAIHEKQTEPTPDSVSVALHNIGRIYVAKGQLDKAESALKRSLEIMESKLGATNSEVAVVLESVSELYDLQGRSTEADKASARALDIREKQLGPMHPAVAESLQNLAYRYEDQGKFELAEPLYRRAVKISEKTLGPASPNLATILSNFALHHWERGNKKSAIELLSRAGDVREQSLVLSLIVGSEDQKRTLLSNQLEGTYAAVSLNVAADRLDHDATRMGMTSVLRHKGRLLDAVAETYQSLYRRLGSDEQALLHKLRDTSARQARLALTGPGRDIEVFGRTLSGLESERKQIEDAISLRNAEFSDRSNPVTLEKVQAALPQGAALVEVIYYRPFDPTAEDKSSSLGAGRYAAYVLKNSGPPSLVELSKKGEPLWRDMGEAKDIDADVSRLRMALRCPQTVDDIKECPAITEVKRLARSLDERVMRPVRKLLGGARHIFISPDGALNLVPFGALVDERGKYLIERYSLTYLTSGRDLLRVQLNVESREPPLVVADPAFGKAGQASAGRGGPEATPSKRSADMVAVDFKPLPATAAEARALAAVLPNARVLTQAQAMEVALKGVSSPRVLHVATHGFFLPDQPEEKADGTRARGSAGDGIGPRMIIRLENPLLRSGLALAGANLPQPAGEEDGILTALEAAGLDLWGTELVVLSACETGVGTVQNGDGVYGLRRALVLAGSKSQVMSLWQVSDVATKDLMVGYYKRLLAGEGRTEALRQVQLEMLKGRKLSSAKQNRELSGKGSVVSADRRHPYYWAAFIQSGDWRGLRYQQNSPPR